VKTIISIFFNFILISIISFSNTASAHGGGLDRYGCHNETKTGGYHCHRSSGWGGSLPGSGSSSIIGSSDLDKKVLSFNDTELFNGDFIVKNFGCYVLSGWKMDVVNRTKNTATLKYEITFLDSDKDPLMSWSDDIFIQSRGRAVAKYSGSISNALNGNGSHNSLINTHCIENTTISWSWTKK
jgi:hypothetical protein